MAGITVAVGVQDDSYISKHDREFIGPDQRLELLLKQRMTPPSFVVGDLRALENSLGPKPKPYVPPGDARRQIKFNEYNGEHLKVRILQFQEYLIHLSRGFIPKIEILVEKFQDDMRVQVAFTFGKLKQWLQRIRTLYRATLTHRYRKERWYSRTPRPIIVIYFYYQHMLRIHVDITYTIEFLTYSHDKYVSVMKTRNVSSGFNDGNDEESQLDKYGDLYEKLQSRNLSQEQLKEMGQAAEAGLKVTLPPE